MKPPPWKPERGRGWFGSGTAGLVVSLASFSAGAAPSLLQARWHSPRVVAGDRPDTYSLRAMREFSRWRDLEGDALARELFRYLTDPVTGLASMGVGSFEREPEHYDLGLVRDPVKLLNVYTTGYCDVFGPALAGLWEGMGLGPARTVNLPGWGHVATEVFYGGGWHYLDLDVRAVFERPDGTLASLAEARAEPSLWGPSRPRFFPLDDPARVREIYRRSEVLHRYGVAATGHTMDFVLRFGERLTRWWKPQGDRWNHHASWNRPWVRRLLERAPRGPKPKHPSFSSRSSANGRFLWRPDLTNRSRDFEDGLWDARGVVTDDLGLTLAEGSHRGHAIFSVRSPWVIVPVVGDPETRDDDRGASVVRIDASWARLSLSTDEGKAWRDLGEARGKRRIDLTPWVAGRYGYLLRVELAGRPRDARVRSLEIETWVQLNPASLPALHRGTNRFRLAGGDDRGLATRALVVQPDAGDREALLRWCSTPPRHYDPERWTGRIRGPFVVRIDAPPRTRIAWLTVGGSFRVHQGADAPRTANRMAWATRPQGPFTELYRARVPPDQSHWHQDVDRPVGLPAPARTVWLRYVGQPAVNSVRVTAHLLDERERPRAPLRVIHRWREGGEERSRVVEPAVGGAWSIDAGQEPENVSITLEVPSARVE